MKNKILFLLFIFNISTSAQNTELHGNIKELKTEKSIPFATIAFVDRNVGTYSDTNGVFKLTATPNDSLVQISSIGYQSVILNIKKLSNNIYLNPISENLDEIIISKSKVKYTKTVHIGIRQTKPKIRKGLQFGHEFSTLIENTYKKNGQIKNVILSLNKSNEFDYLATYNLKFYAYDSIKKQPSELVYFDNIIVKPENKTHKLKIEVEHLNIPLPKSGICVGIEILNTKGFKTTDLISVAPYINFTETDKSKITWSAFRNKDWIKRTRESHLKHGSFINAKIELTGKI